MKYALLIYGDENYYDGLAQEAVEADMNAYFAFDERNADAIVAGEALQPTATATTVRKPDGERLLTDGPFAETREQFGGFYVVDVPGLDEALELAAQLPMNDGGCVEVRPIMTFDDPS